MKAVNCRCDELEDEEMKPQRVTISLTIAAICVAAIATQARQTQVISDPVVASFDRALSHEAGPSVPAVRTDIDNDVLYALVNQPLHSRDTAAGATVESGADDD